MSGADVYAVASGKGGVGKSTTALALGACAAGADLDTVVVDADLGMPNLGRLVDVEPAGSTLHDVLAGEATTAAACREAPGGFDLLPGGDSVAGYAAADPAGIRAVLDDLRESYDVVVVDTAAGLSHETALPAVLADGTVLVTTPDAVSVGDAVRTRDVAERLDATVAGTVVTRSHDASGDEVAEEVGARLLAVVPEDDAVQAAAAAGVPVPVHAPDSPAAAAYCDAAAALFDVAVTDIDLGGTTPEEVIPFEADGSGDDEADDGDDGPIVAEAEPTDDGDTDGNGDADDDGDAGESAADEGTSESDDGDESDDSDESADGGGDEGDESDDGTDESGGFLSRLFG